MESPQQQLSKSVKFRIVLLALAGVALLAGIAGFLLIRIQRSPDAKDASKPLSSQLISAAPMLSVADIEKSTSFYRDKFGFRVLEQSSEIVLLGRAGLRLYLVPLSPPTADKPNITLGPPDAGNYVSVNLVSEVKDCRSAYEQLTQAGVEFITPPQRLSWGGWRCFARDPDGYLIEVVESPESGGDVDFTPFL